MPGWLEWFGGSSRLRRAGSRVVFAGFSLLLAFHAAIPVSTALDGRMTNPALLILSTGLAALLIWMAWRGFARGRCGALLVGTVLLLLYSLVLLAFASMAGEPGLFDDEPSMTPEEAGAFLRETCRYLLALWMASTAGTVLALRVREDEERGRAFPALAGGGSLPPGPGNSG